MNNGSRRQYWRMMCQTRHHPGQWQTWLIEQCCAVGWHPRTWKDQTDDEEFWTFDQSIRAHGAWKVARQALHDMRQGDIIVAMLPGGRVGRVGEVVRKAVEDHDWNPIIPPRRADTGSIEDRPLPFGENGRRILVRWDLRLGPANFAHVTQLPKGQRNFGQQAISRLSESQYKKITEAMSIREYWVPFYGNFRFEEALSDYIAMHPYRLEDGMVVHPGIKQIREFRLTPGHQIDVVLMDRNQVPVIVECKQGAAMSDHLLQLSKYLQEFKKRYPEPDPLPRGILVHGGSRRVSDELRKLAGDNRIELVYHELKVDFLGSG